MITEGPKVYRYVPQGNHLDIWKSDSKELCIFGAAGTGKTRCYLEKLFAICNKYPNVRVLICRKTRDSLNESVLETFENEVVPEDHPIMTSMQRRIRQKYVFPNKSEIILGGLDNVKKILSSRYDFIYVGEAIETSLDEVETLKTRLRAYNYKYRQLCLDTNPGSFNHWIYKRYKAGSLKFIKTVHQDNPLFWDEIKQDWTEEGKDYVLETLASMTGHRRQKYYTGEWGLSEGIVYSDWNSEKIIIPRFKLPLGTKYYGTIDFGYNDPFFFGVCGVTPRNNLYLLKQVYYSRRTVEEHLPSILQMLEDLEREQNNFRLYRLIMDTAQKGEGVQLAKSLKTARVGANKKSISTNIDILSTAMSHSGTDKPGFYIFEDSLFEVDEYLRDDRNLPTRVEEEFPLYTWKMDPSGSVALDVPIDKYNHGINGLEYISNYVWGSTRQKRSLGIL